MRLLVSDMAGRASIELKGRELGFDLSDDRELVDRVTDAGQGAGVARLHLRGGRRVLRAAARRGGRGRPPVVLRVESWRVITETSPREPGEEAVSEATVKLRAGGERHRRAPARATARSTRSTRRCAQAIGQAYPEVAKFELIDYKVRILDQGHGTDAITRVLIETSDGERRWVTVGVGAQRDRGVLGGPGRRPHVRPAPPGPRGSG